MKIRPVGTDFFSPVQIDGETDRQTDCDDAEFHSVGHTAVSSCWQHDCLTGSYKTDFVRPNVQIIVTEHLNPPPPKKEKENRRRTIFPENLILSKTMWKISV